MIDYDDATSGLNGGVSTNGTFVTITAVAALSVIPEPSTALLSALGLLALLRRRR